MARPKKSASAKKKTTAKKASVRKPRKIDLKSSLAKLTSRRNTASKPIAAKKAQPLVFTIEDAREELERLEQQREEVLEAAQPVAKSKAAVKKTKSTKKKAQVVGAASIMDLLGLTLPPKPVGKRMRSPRCLKNGCHITTHLLNFDNTSRKS